MNKDEVEMAQVRILKFKCISMVLIVNILFILIMICKASKKKRMEAADAATVVATPTDEAEEVKLLVPFEDCLDTYFGAELVDMGRGVTASKTTKLLGFPRYLMVKLGRYTIDSSWRQVKVMYFTTLLHTAFMFYTLFWIDLISSNLNMNHQIDARVPMPESLDINHLKATGIQAGEEIIEENATVVSSAGAVTPDAMLVSQVIDSCDL